MRASNQPIPPLVYVTVALLALLSLFVARYGFASLRGAPAWAAAAVKMKLTKELDPSAGAPYERTAVAPLPLATVVQEMRKEWPKETLALIHTTALEVGTALLHRSDIEVGEIVDGKFVPSQVARWQINASMNSEIKGSPTLFDNEQVYVFRRK